jgi:hypothetical protein
MLFLLSIQEFDIQYSNVTKRPPFVTKSVLSPWRRTKSPERLGRTLRTLPASTHEGILWAIASSIRAGLIG